MPESRFEELILPHLDAAYSLARWLARDGDDAEDVVQDACVRAIKYLDSLRGSEGRVWFLAIVRRAFYDWCERNRPAEILRNATEALDAAVDPAIGPERTLLRDADSLALTDALAALPLPYREALVLRELQELSYKEISRITDVPMGTVMSRIARARSLLQRSPQLQSMRAPLPRSSP